MTSRDHETTTPGDQGATRPRRRRAGGLAAAMPAAVAPPPVDPDRERARERARERVAEPPPAAKPAPQTTIRFDDRERLAIGRLQLHALTVNGGAPPAVADLVRAALLLVDDDVTLRDQLVRQLLRRPRGEPAEPEPPRG